MPGPERTGGPRFFYETLDRPGYYLILMGARAGINEEVAFRGISTVLLNSFFAASMGIIFGAVFTLSGNIWPCIFLHSLYDYLAFSSEFTDLAPDGLSDFEVGVFVVMAIAFLFVLYRKREEICPLWNRKWTNPLPEREYMELSNYDGKYGRIQRKPVTTGKAHENRS